MGPVQAGLPLFPSHRVLVTLHKQLFYGPPEVPTETSRQSEETQMNQKQGLLFYQILQSMFQPMDEG